MAIQSPFFNKRDNEATANRVPNAPVASQTPAASSPQGNPYANTHPGYPTATTANASNPAGHLNPSNGAPTPSATSSINPPKESSSKLTVGPNIKLKGVEITDCDTLVVEGTVEATMDSRLMQISEQGAFNGSADIDIAEIHGTFDGNLTVRKKLVIYATGKVTGKIRYGKVVIEEGGQLSGEIQFGAAPSANSAGKAVSARPELQIIG